MAKLISKKTREIVLTSAVLVLVALFITFYIVYPLITIPGMTARVDREKFEDESFRPTNDPSFFVNSGLNPDTFSVLSNDNISLAGLYFQSDTTSPAKGTLIILHPDDTDRTALVDFIKPLKDSGWKIVVYDQRASGLSGGIYHFGGSYEADDLTEVISHLNVHSQLSSPLVILGFGLGGDAALNAARTEKRISGVIAIDPYLTTTEWLVARKEKTRTLWIPLYKMIYFWWYQKLSSYTFDRTGVDDIREIEAKTILVVAQTKLGLPQFARFREIMPSARLTILPRPNEGGDLRNLVIEKIESLQIQ